MDIAVVVTGGVAETLQATPLLRTLRAGEPGGRLTLVCPAGAADVARGIPPVDVVVGVAALGGTPRLDALPRLWWELRRRRLDCVVLCSSAASVRGAAFLAGVARRLGPGRGVTGILLTGRGSVEQGENRAATWLRLASLAGIRQELHAPAYEPGQEALREADHIIHGTGFADGRLLIALAPGAGYAEEQAGEPLVWDEERYALLANQLAQRHGAGIIFLGTASDRAAVERCMLDLRVPVVDLSGQLELPIIGALLARCDLLVSGDTALLHLAASVGTAAVGLFGPTDGRARGPYGSDHRIIQGLRGAPGAAPDGDGARTMARIRVEDVLASIEASI